MRLLAITPAGTVLGILICVGITAFWGIVEGVARIFGWKPGRGKAWRRAEHLAALRQHELDLRAKHEQEAQIKGR